MMRQFFLIGIMILVIAPKADAQDDPPVPTFNPPSIETDLCAAECYETTVQIQLPPRELIEPPSLDVFLVMDVTGSMEDELNTVKAEAGNITAALRDLVPDLRIGFGTYSDYGTFAWREDVPFTEDVDTFQGDIQSVELDEQGGQEPGWRALFEISEMAWRPDAQKITVLFTDERFLPNDPGRDAQYNTADDIRPSIVLDNFKAQGIQLIAVNAGGGDRERTFLQEIVGLVDGNFFDLESASDIPQVIVGQVGATLADYVVAITGVENADDWINVQNERFAYPYDGQPIDIPLQICPSAATLEAGDYQLGLDVSNNGQTVGNVPIMLSYRAGCVDLLIQDTPDDDGLACSAALNTSPAIILRNEADEGATSQPPRVGERNTVYVRLQNRGIRPDESVTVRLYGASSLLVSDERAMWELVGEQQTRIAATDEILIPFTWTPESGAVALRAEVESPQDPIRAENDPACESNISQRVEHYVKLDQPSAGDGYWRGEAPFSLTLPPDLAGVYDLTFAQTTDDMPDVRVFELTLPKSLAPNADNGQLPLRLAGLFTPDQTSIMGEWALESKSDAAIEVTLSQSGTDQPISGGYLIFYRDETAKIAEDALPNLDAEGPTNTSAPPPIIPLGVAATLFALIGVAWMNRKR